jgi:hypothetical protein
MQTGVNSECKGEGEHAAMRWCERGFVMRERCFWLSLLWYCFWVVRGLRQWAVSILILGSCCHDNRAGDEARWLLIVEPAH